ncbi:MAG: DivIVA domain-containing protein [Ruminococcaceae bacterium]|nr:DivIVA domain-containing protein [Oscillospiraceae bacterium]
MILPEEIENQQFEVSFRGYNTREVDEFLAKVHADLCDLIKEQDVLKKKIAAAELIAKDAKDREEEFVASMQSDRDEATAVLTAARNEGERIIREAKNAATGIMAEVRRRAGEISSESKRAATELLEGAKASADELVANAGAEADAITESARAEADQRLYSARTEADNIVKAAEAQARAVISEAKENSKALYENAADSAKDYDAFIKEIRHTADSICHELDAELKNSAARISLLGRRIAAMNVSALPTEEEAPVATEAPAKMEPAVKEDIPEVAEPSFEETDNASTAEFEVIRTDKVAHAKPSGKANKVKSGNASGYFTEEYRQVMEELFGGDNGNASVPEDDDTYDYLEKVSYSIDDSGEDEDISDNNEVTSEYTGLSGGAKDEELDMFSSAEIDRIYKSPSADDINDIMNEF